VNLIVMVLYVYLTMSIQIQNTKPICNAPISPSKKLPESEAQEATVTGSDQRTMVRGVKQFAFKIAFKLLTQVAARQLKDKNRKCLVRHDEGRVRTCKDVSGINFVVLSVNLIPVFQSLTCLFMLQTHLLTLSTHHSHHP